MNFLNLYLKIHCIKFFDLMYYKVEISNFDPIRMIEPEINLHFYMYD
jgi:hypothetical protein